MTVQTYVQGSNGTAYKVDYGEIDQTFEAETGRVIQNGEIEVVNPVTYATTSSYILRFRTESVVPEGGRITIEIPEPLVIYENIMTSGGTCASATCSVDVEARTVSWTVTEEIIGGEDIEFTLKGVRNPRTTETTGTFFITTWAANLRSQIDSGYSVATQVTEMGTLTSFGAVPGNVTNGAENTYTFSLQTQIPIAEGDQLFFTIPSQITVPETANELNCRPGDKIVRLRCSVSGRNI